MILPFPAPTLPRVDGDVDTTRDRDIKIDGWLISVRGFVRFSHTVSALWKSGRMAEV